MARPPPGRGSAVIAAPWVVAIALTMDRPRPWPPSRRAGRGPSRWKGWNRRSTSVGRDDRPGVSHRQDGVTVAGAGSDLDIPAGDVVPDGVVDQVGHQLLNQERVTVEDGGLDVGVDVQAEAADPGLGGGQGGAGDVRQVQGLALAGVGFAAGQGEQRLDEAFLLGVGGEQFLADSPPGAGGARRVGEGDLEQGAFPRQRGAQLVRGVGGETPLGVERGLQPREQAVEGVGEFLELVVGSVQGQPLVQAAGGDPPGGGGDRAQRAQHPAGDDPADRGGRHRDARQQDGADEHDLPLVVVDAKLRIGEQRSLLGGGGAGRPLEPPGGGDGHKGVDYVVATCALNVGDGEFEADFGYVVGTCALNVGDGDFVAECRGGGAFRLIGGQLVRRVPEEQVGNDGEHGCAAGQERRAVQDGKAQPGAAAGRPQPARAAGARAGSVHYGSPMR